METALTCPIIAIPLTRHVERLSVWHTEFYSLFTPNAAKGFDSFPPAKLKKMKGGIIMPTEDLEYYTMRVGEPLTAEEKAEIAALKGRPIVYDEDCPPMSKEEHEEIRYLIRKYKTRYITNEMWMKEFPERFKNRGVG